MIYIILVIILFLLLVNIKFYRKTNYDLDIHKFKKIPLCDLKSLYKLRQPIKFTYKMAQIDTNNLNKIFNNKLVNLFDNKKDTIEEIKWKPSLIKTIKKNKYIESTFESNKNTDFKSTLNYKNEERYIIMNSNITTIPKYTNYYFEIITPIKSKCTIRIIKNSEKHYLNLNKKDNNEDEIYFSNNIYDTQNENKEVILNVGECLLIPSKWIYSIHSTEDNIILNQIYNTYLNKISHIYEYIKYKNNIK